MLENTYLVPKYFREHGVQHRLEKRALLIAVNLVAGLSIFFFGYDQGNFKQTSQFGAHANSSQVSWYEFLKCLESFEANQLTTSSREE